MDNTFGHAHGNAAVATGITTTLIGGGTSVGTLNAAPELPAFDKSLHKLDEITNGFGALEERLYKVLARLAYGCVSTGRDTKEDSKPPAPSDVLGRLNHKLDVLHGVGVVTTNIVERLEAL